MGYGLGFLPGEKQPLQRLGPISCPYCNKVLYHPASPSKDPGPGSGHGSKQYPWYNPENDKKNT